MKKNTKILVATHKEYRMPDESIYMPLHVGKAIGNNLGYIGDDTGDNISKKNKNFCELTGLYWAYKNLNNNYIGLVHYRRYFKGKSKSKDKFERILTSEEINNILKQSDIILPKKRNYFIETLYSHYKHTLYIEPLDKTRDIIEKKYPEYLKEFDKLKIRRKAHMFNMFIMRKDILDLYCDWLFDILFELEKNIDISLYNEFHSRFFGRISELLLDVWINTNNLKYVEIPVINIEKNKIIKKGIMFLKAKYFGKKYEKSA